MSSELISQTKEQEKTTLSLLYETVDYAPASQTKDESQNSYSNIGRSPTFILSINIGILPTFPYLWNLPAKQTVVMNL